jgi:muramidase (phage lysozyme)
LLRIEAARIDTWDKDIEMARISAQKAGGANVLAFLDMIAISELGHGLLTPATDDGYRVIVGSTPAHPSLMSSYADHPRQLVQLRSGLASTAAGRYQLLARYYDTYKRSLNLNDFGPISQDRIAIQQILERRALALVQAGKFAEAVAACSCIWASLPGNAYGQHQNTLARLQAAYQTAGGTLTA